MPKAASYRANSVIYFQGDVSDRIFILQSGQVVLGYSDIETGKELREVIQTGEFFGVKSALGKYPREENAAVVSDAQVLAFTVPEFEQFVSANTRIILKMLRVFSNQLRRIHKQVDNLMEKQESLSPELGLFRTGEYYLKNRMYSQGKYVFSRYLTYYPAGKLSEPASKNLETAESCMVKYGDGKGPAPIVAGMPAGIQKSAGGEPRAEEAAGSARAVDSLRPQQGQALSDTAKAYYNAISLFSQEKYKEALIEFKRIVEANQDPEYVVKAAYDMGRSVFMLGQFDAAIAHFTRMVQTYPKHPDLADILYYLGQSYNKKGDTERAKGFFKKILTMEKDEDNSTYLRAKKALRSMEEVPNG
jgi:CRP-like cAMP-binding protein/TolA-binding protein